MRVISDDMTGYLLCMKVNENKNKKWVTSPLEKRHVIGTSSNEQIVRRYSMHL